MIRWAGHTHLLPSLESRWLFRWLSTPGSVTRLYLVLALGILRAACQRVPRRALLIHTGHGGLDHPGYRRLVEYHAARLVIMIHDLIPLTHPQFCRVDENHRHAARLRQGLALACGVICNSAATAAALHRWANAEGLTVPPTTVGWLAPALGRRVSRPAPLATPYFVVLGTLEPRKNHALLINVWHALRATPGLQRPRLVVIGQPGWDFDETLTQLRAGESRGDFVLAIAGCDDATTTVWLQHAKALLFPSFAEGYGLPLIEALTLGVPVLASDLPAFREIAGDHAHYLDPTDINAWTRAVRAQCAAPPIATRGFMPPTWAQHFHVVETFLRTLPDSSTSAGSVVYAWRFSAWKKPVVRALFVGRRVHFVEASAALPPGATVALWGREAPALAERIDLVRLYLEDGFLRSVGLGAALTRALSWVCDHQGLYYDARAPCDLETLLANGVFTPEDAARAARLRANIVAAGLTKYNLGGTVWRRPTVDGPVILVPGQVESDASIRLGSPQVKTNFALVEAVRAQHPRAFIVYKPHPDVRAGLRAAGPDESRIAGLVDQILGEVDLTTVLTQVDAVHVMTSLTGFEALLREIPVVCHGQPFYAGWGLTQDRHPSPRRHRQLTLDELVSGVLVRYALYFDRDTGARMAPEDAIEALVQWRRHTRTDRWWQPLWHRVVRRIVGVR